jgi:uncharacterized protein (TIGR00251 family)
MKDKQHIRITVFPESSKAQVKQRSDTAYSVYVQASASDGAANKEALETLREYLKISGQIRIVSGHRAPKKIVEITQGH